MIIDGHAHIGASARPLDRYAIYPYLSKTTEDIVHLMDKFGIDKACVSTTKLKTRYFIGANESLKKEVERFPDRFIPFCFVVPRALEEAIEEIRKYVSLGWKGVQLHPFYGEYAANTPFVKRIVQEAGRLVVPVLIHSSDSMYCEPWRIGELAEKVPEATIIMGHSGGLLWEDAVEYAAEYKNIVLDTACAKHDWDFLPRAVRRIGAERIVFGTDLPFGYPNPNLVAVKTACIDEEAKKLILGENMIRLLKDLR